MIKEFRSVKKYIASLLAVSCFESGFLSINLKQNKKGLSFLLISNTIQLDIAIKIYIIIITKVNFFNNSKFINI